MGIRKKRFRKRCDRPRFFVKGIYFTRPNLTRGHIYLIYYLPCEPRKPTMDSSPTLCLVLDGVPGQLVAVDDWVHCRGGVWAMEGSRLVPWSVAEKYEVQARSLVA